MTGSTRFSLKNCVVPRRVAMVSLVASRTGLISLFNKLINRAIWTMTATSAVLIISDSSAMKIRNISRHLSVGVLGWSKNQPAAIINIRIATVATPTTIIICRCWRRASGSGGVDAGVGVPMFAADSAIKLL